MTTGVLLMAHGTPAAASEIAPFYTRIRRGRPPTPDQLADLEARYAAIGGVSPLALRTAAQVDAVRAELAARAPGRYIVSFGAKHTEPLIEESAALLGAAGLERVIGLVLTPHGSSLGSQEYLDRAEVALGATPFVPVAPWYAHPALVALLAARVQDARRALTGRTKVIFTAHSLPERIRETGDTYAEQLTESARLVATAAGLDDWIVAWQSAGRTPEALARSRRARRRAPTRGRATGRRRRRLSDRVRDGPPRGALRPRRRSWRASRRRVASAMCAPHRSTTTPPSSPRWPT